MKLELIGDLEALYPTFESWWRGHGWPAVPQVMLPKLGILASEGDAPVAAAWLYMDNSVAVCMLEWMVADPAAPPRLSSKALHHAVTFLKQEAARLGYGMMLATCRQPGLSRFLEKRGFQVTDRGMTHHLANLKLDHHEH